MLLLRKIKDLVKEVKEYDAKPRPLPSQDPPLCVIADTVRDEETGRYLIVLYHTHILLSYLLSVSSLSLIHPRLSNNLAILFSPFLITSFLLINLFLIPIPINCFLLPNSFYYYSSPFLPLLLLLLHLIILSSFKSSSSLF